MKKATILILVITLILSTLTLASCSQKDININQSKPINIKAEIIHINGDIVIASVEGKTTTICITEQYLTLGAIQKYEFLEVKSGDFVDIRITEGRISDINLTSKK